MKHATNASTMRTSNRKLILNLIRQGPISRVELATKTNLTRACITQIVDELLQAGLVEAISTIENSGLGRRRTLLALCHNARYVFGVNIRRHHCEVGIIDLYGDVLAEQVLSVENRPAADVIDDIAHTVILQQKQLDIPKEHIIGIGISAPGPVDYRNGILLNPPNFNTWHNLPLVSLLQEKTGYPASLEKDANCRALEEKYFGAAKEISNFMLVQVDDGVGSGVIIRDRLYRGAHGMGAEIGHMSICFDGPFCSCGNRGCLETFLRLPSLLQNSRFTCWEQLACSASEPDADAILESASNYLATALVNAINLYDLEQILLTGDMASCPQPLLERTHPLLKSRILNRSQLIDPPVLASLPVSPVRTGAMAILHEMFQD